MQRPRFMPFAAVAFGLAVAGCEQASTSPEVVDSPLFSATVTKTNIKAPFSQFAFVPCANGGIGELVLLSGTLHILSHTTISNSGNVSSKFHFQPQGATGTGMTTGDIYRATGVTQQTQTIQGDGLPFEFTFVNNFKIIGPGPNNNLLLHQNVHVTIDNNGNVTANVNNSSVKCQ